MFAVRKHNCFTKIINLNYKYYSKRKGVEVTTTDSSIQNDAVNSSENIILKYVKNKACARIILSSNCLMDIRRKNSYREVKSTIEVFEHYFGNKEISRALVKNLIKLSSPGIIGAQVAQLKLMGYPVNMDSFERLSKFTKLKLHKKDDNSRFNEDVRNSINLSLKKYGIPEKEVLALASQNKNRNATGRIQLRNTLMTILKFKYGDNTKLCYLYLKYGYGIPFDYFLLCMELLDADQNVNVPYILEVCFKFDPFVHSKVYALLRLYDFGLIPITDLHQKLCILENLHINILNMDVRILSLPLRRIEKLVNRFLEVMPLERLRKQKDLEKKILLSRKLQYLRIDEPSCLSNKIMYMDKRKLSKAKTNLMIFCCYLYLHIPIQKVNQFLDNLEIRNYPNISVLSNNLTYLENLGYTTEEINSCYQLLFFDHNIVKTYMANYFRLNPKYDSVAFTNEEYLQLILTYVYNDYHLKQYSGFNK